MQSNQWVVCAFLKFHSIVSIPPDVWALVKNLNFLLSTSALASSVFDLCRVYYRLSVRFYTYFFVELW